MAIVPWYHRTGAPMTDFQLTASIQKATEPEDGLVRLWGWAAMSRDDLGEPVVDSDGDYIPIEELEKAAQRAFVERSGAGAIGTQHQVYRQADLVESFVLTREKRQAFGLGDGPLGWMVGLQSRNADVIKAVRSGQLMELSIRGRGQRQAVSVPPGRASDILKSEQGQPAEAATVNVVRQLELSDAELLSIVDRGASANERVRSRVVLVKRQSNGGATMPETDVKKMRSPQVILADLFEQGKLVDLPAEEKEALLTAMGSVPAMPAPVAEPEPVIEAEGEDEVPKAEDEDEMPKADDEGEEMSKREHELVKANAALKLRLDDLKKRAKRAEVTELVKSEMAYFPGASTDELVDVVQEGRLNLGSETAAKLEKMLKAASEVCKDSDILKTAGVRKGDGGEGSPQTELLELAKSLRDKDPKLSRHESIKQAGKQRPDLWAARNGASK